MTEYFSKNDKGKVEFDEISLKRLLDRVYNQGYNDGKYHGSIIWNSPPNWYDQWSTTPYITWTSGSSSSSSNTITNADYNSTTTTTATINANELNKESI